MRWPGGPALRSRPRAPLTIRRAVLRPAQLWPATQRRSLRQPSPRDRPAPLWILVRELQYRVVSHCGKSRRGIIASALRNSPHGDDYTVQHSRSLRYIDAVVAHPKTIAADACNRVATARAHRFRHSCTLCVAVPARRHSRVIIALAMHAESHSMVLWSCISTTCEGVS